MRRPSARAVVLDAWPLLLSVVLCWPLLSGRGLPLARDLVFVPRQPFTDASIGLGDAAPRAVPLDAVVSVLSQAVGGEVLARVLVPGLLALAGWGAHRLLAQHGMAARLAAGGFAVWNPWTVERLSLGQWALIGGYAALPFVLAATVRLRREWGLANFSRLVLVAALGSLTPTGGLLAVLVVAATTLGRSARGWLATGVVLVLQLPWVVAGAVGAAGLTSDPDGVTAFAARGDGVGHGVGALLGLGGIWDGRSVPASREAVWSWLALAVTILACTFGWAALRRVCPSRTLTGAAVAAGVGLGLASLSSLPGGAALVQLMVESVPGAGLLRDSQKFLAPFVLFVVVSGGAAVGRLSAAVADRDGLAGTVLVGGLFLPVVLLPDATTVTWPTVTPVAVPPGFARAADIVAAQDREPGCRMVSLPWRSYRLYPWGSGDTSSDLAVRMFDCSVIAEDSLQVGDTVVSGENAAAAETARALAEGRPADVLAARGVGWVLVQQDDPESAGLDLSGLEEEYEDDSVALYRVPGATARPPSVPVSRQEMVWFATLITFLTALLASVGLVFATFRTRNR
ncbi:hypothetical protein [Nocardioides sp. 616]|uniref:hypothetical protein n=1 Tax=Nocardioides sp. 616 TaxID=2268090 RepID=UPI0013B3F1BA|nr:hypothetical protein [Nocardioides sp. 616]